jgi:hypothetical protein
MENRHGRVSVKSDITLLVTSRMVVSVGAPDPSPRFCILTNRGSGLRPARLRQAVDIAARNKHPRRVLSRRAHLSHRWSGIAWSIDCSLQ